MTDQHPGDMDSNEFRKYGKQLIDWIADYLEHDDQYPVLSRVKPGEIKAQLPGEPPALEGSRARRPGGRRTARPTTPPVRSRDAKRVKWPFSAELTDRGQPAGLPEGSRWSPGVLGGGDLRAAAQEKSCTPAGGMVLT